MQAVISSLASAASAHDDQVKSLPGVSIRSMAASRIWMRVVVGEVLMGRFCVQKLIT